MRYFEETVSAGAATPRRSRVLNAYGSSIFPPLRKPFPALNLDKFRICGTMRCILNA